MIYLPRCRLIQRSRATVRMLQHFQKLSRSLSWFSMSDNVSEVVSQVFAFKTESLHC